MRKFKTIVSIALFCTVMANAQSELRISLSQAREISLKNRFDLKAEQINIEIAKKEVIRKRQALLPDFNASARISYSPEIQSTLIPPGFGGLTETSLLALGAKSTSIFSLESYQTLYDPTLYTDIKLARNAEDISRERKHEKEIEIKKQVSLAYFNTLLRELQYRISGDEEKRFSEYLIIAEGNYSNGTLIENDYLRAKLDYENSQQQAQISLQDHQQSIATLHYELNLPKETALVLTDNLEFHNSSENFAANLNDAQSRTEYKLLALEEQRNGLIEQKQRNTVQPVISLVANYSQQYLNEKFNYDYSNGQLWSPFNSIGLQIKIPLTGQFTNKTAVAQKHLVSEQTSVLQQQQILDAKYEIEHSVVEVMNASKNFQKAKQNYDLAKRIYENQKMQLELGAFSYEKILNTEKTLSDSESNFIKSSYDFLISILNYDIASGKL